jgi:glucose/arabinose dehydrogenase
VRKRIFASVCAASLAAACGGSADDQGSRRTAEPPSGGLDMRPANATCVAPEPSVDTSVALVRAFPNLSFAQPVAMLQAPGDDSRWFVLEKAGRVRVFRNDAAVEVTEADFIDLRGVVDDGGEGGLLGMAFAPDFSTSRHAYLSWTTQGAPMVSIVARFTSLDDGLTLDPGSRQDILALDQDSAYHNGGQIAFGSDGYLYISMSTRAFRTPFRAARRVTRLPVMRCVPPIIRAPRHARRSSPGGCATRGAGASTA